MRDQTHDIKDKNNNVSFESLDIPYHQYHSLSCQTRCHTISPVSQLVLSDSLSYHITSITACPVRLAVILVMMSVLEFKPDIILYLLSLHLSCLLLRINNLCHLLSFLSYGSWIYNYLCNQCSSPLKL